MEEQPGLINLVHVADKPRKPMKVWSQDGRLRKAVVSSTFFEFRTAAEEKFEVQEAKFVLFSDGTEIDADYWETLPPETIIAILPPGETWQPPTGSSGSSADYNINDSNTSEAADSSDKDRKIQELLEKLRKKNHMPKKKVDHINMRAGWMHFSFSCSKYLLQKNSKNRQRVGPRPVSFRVTNTYQEVLEALKAEFFPNGKNYQGKITSMNASLGNSEGKPILRENFTMASFYQNSITQKPGIYLLTKAQVLDLDDDSDFDLPDLPFSNVRTPSATATATATATDISRLDSSATPTATLTSPRTPNPRPVASFSQATAVSDVWMDTGTPTVDFRSQSQTARPTETQETQLQLPDTRPTTQCNICNDRQKDAFIIPCGHTMCYVCALQIQSYQQNCPHCRARIIRVCSMFD